MRNRCGFTLLELLTVVTILAILAGVAVPFVLNYVEESRISRAKADLDEIRKSVGAFLLARGAWPAGETTLKPLLGPFLTKMMLDPWGSPYEISDQRSVVFSLGSDRLADTADDLTQAFRPPMAVSRVFFIDLNGNGAQDAGDEIQFVCTRPIKAVNQVVSVSFETEGPFPPFHDGATVFGAPFQAAIGGNSVSIKLTDPAGWTNQLRLKQNGKVVISQTAGQEFLCDFSGGPAQWVKNEDGLRLQTRD